MPRILIAVLLLVPFLVLVVWPGDDGGCLRAQEDDAPTFIGSRECKQCHLKQHKSWEKNNLAKAFEVLKPGQAAERKAAQGMDVDADHTKDPACLRCHVTGYGEAGGYPEVGEGVTWSAEQEAHAKRLEGVGCESCHGPGSLYAPYKSKLQKENEDYKRADIAALGARTPLTADACVACHEKVCPAMPEDYTFDAPAVFEETKTGKKVHEHVPLKKPH